MKIKQIPEDFIVEEIIKLRLTRKKLDYAIFSLTKKNWESFRAIGTLAGILRTKNKFIGFAGNKDKNAVTKQYISVYKIPKEKVEKINILGIKIKFVGYSRKRINLGDLEGNKFKITLRDLDRKVRIPRSFSLENYFDEQRFGNKANTHMVGKAILKKNFEEACSLLNIKPNGNPISELRKQPRKLLRFYIAAYQSYLWNKALSNRLSKEKNTAKTKYPLGEFIFTINKIKKFKLPLVNFDADLSKEQEQILEQEEIKKEDFIIRQIPELITESQNRDVFIRVQNIKHSWEKDELNKGKMKLTLSFFLPKGAYATMLLKKLAVIYIK